MANVFRQVLSLVLFLSLPICVGLALTADCFVFLVLGAKWEPAIPVMQISALAACLQILSGTGGPLFWGAGVPKLELVVVLLQLTVTTLLIFPLTKRLGPAGTAWAVLFGSAAIVPLWWTFSRRISTLSGREIMFGIFPSLIATVLMAGGVLLVRVATRGVISSPAFAARVLTGVVIFAHVCESLGMCSD